MSDYISREALAKEMCKAICGEERNLCVSAPRNCHQRCMVPIYAAPTVQTEVRHGRWEWADDGYCRCSECRQRAPVVYGVLVEDHQDEPRTTMTNFCPNCGAKMDLEGENG